MCISLQELTKSSIFPVINPRVSFEQEWKTHKCLPSIVDLMYKQLRRECKASAGQTKSNSLATRELSDSTPNPVQQKTCLLSCSQAQVNQHHPSSLCTNNSLATGSARFGIQIRATRFEQQLQIQLG